MSDSIPDSLVSPELDVAVRAARAGAEVLLRWRKSTLEVRSPSPNFVTAADIEAERAVCATIREAFPDHAIFSEEAGRDKRQSAWLWVVDPLDGTTNFVHGIDQFAVSIALYRAGQPQLGVILRPASDDWFIAVSGNGAWRNGQRVQVSPAQQLEEALLGVGFYYDRGQMMRATLDAMATLFSQGIRGFRRMGAASLDLCMVGCGQLAGYFEFELSPWDFAAGQLFVTEAGGRVTDCAGHSLGLQRSSVLASNAALHDKLLQFVGLHWNESGIPKN